MKKSKYVIIGLGNIGLELLKKISRDIDLVCVELNPELQELALTAREDGIFFAGDATSRLVLEEAGVSDADAVIITTTTEKVNIETARILKEHFDAKRVISLGTTTAGKEALEALGVEVESIFTASAVAIRNRLAQASRAAHAIGLGKEEILEVEVHPHSRLANRPLRTLTPLRWRIGIIYRDENIVVPGRDTVLKPRDRVVILGEPAALKTVSEILTFKFERFPLEYGSTAVSYLTGNETDVFFKELDYLLSIFPLNKVIFVYSGKAARKADSFNELIQQLTLKNTVAKKTSLPILPAIGDAVSELRGDPGIIVMAKDPLPSLPFGLFRSRGNKMLLASLIQEFQCPIMLTAGSYPYESVCAPCVEHVNIQHMMETGLEITASLQNEVTALLVHPSRYISSDEDVDAFEAAKKTINDVSSMYKISVNKMILQGNPVKTIIASSGDFNLLITGTEGWRQRRLMPSFLSPDIVWNIVRKACISTLLLPAAEELL